MSTVTNIVNVHLDTKPKTKNIIRIIYCVTIHFAPGSGPICVVDSQVLTELYRNNFNLNNLRAVNTICHIWT